MKKGSVLGGFVVIAMIFLTVISTGCGSKSGKRQPSSIGTEFQNFHISGIDTIWTGKISLWKYDSKVGHVSAWFDGNKDGVSSLPFIGDENTINSLMDKDLDSVGIKRNWKDNGAGGYYQELKFVEFYSGTKYNPGDKVFVMPDAMNVNFDSTGTISYLSVDSYVGDIKSIEINPNIGIDFILDILESKTRPVIQGEYMDQTFRMVTYSVSSK